MHCGKCRVSVTLDIYPLQDTVNLSQLLFSQGDLLDVFLNALRRRSARNGDDGGKTILATVLPDPRKANLPKRRLLVLGDFLDLICQLEVFIEDVRLETRRVTTEVVFRDVVDTADLAGLFGEALESQHLRFHGERLTRNPRPSGE